MMKRWVALLLALSLQTSALLSQAAQINRLHQDTITNGSVINANDLNDEFNGLVNESNSQDTRLNAHDTTLTTVNSANTTQDTRLNTLETINKGTRSTDVVSPSPGNLWYNTSSNEFRARFASSVMPIMSPGLLPRLIIGQPPEFASTSTVVLRSGLTVTDDTNSAMITLPTDITLNITTSGVSGLDTGSEAASTWYYIWLIRKSSDGSVASLLSASSTMPTLPSGYDQKRRLPIAIRNDASSNFIDFYVSSGWPYRPEVQYNVNIGDYAGAGANNVLWAGSATTFSDISLASLVPPISRQAVLKLEYYFSSTQGSMRVREKGKTHEGYQLISNPSANTTPTILTLPCDASQVIQYRSSVASTSDYIWVLGYIVTDLL